MGIDLSLTINFLLSKPTSLSKNLPCAVSYFNKYANVSASVKSLIPTTSKLLSWDSNLKANLPILPNPLIPTLIDILFSPYFRLTL